MCGVYFALKSQINTARLGDNSSNNTNCFLISFFSYK